MLHLWKGELEVADALQCSSSTPERYQYNDIRCNVAIHGPHIVQCACLKCADASECAAFMDNLPGALQFFISVCGLLFSLGEISSDYKVQNFGEGASRC